MATPTDILKRKHHTARPEQLEFRELRKGFPSTSKSSPLYGERALENQVFSTINHIIVLTAAHNEASI